MMTTLIYKTGTAIVQSCMRKDKGKVTIIREIRKTAWRPPRAWYEAEIKDKKSTAVVKIRKPAA